MEAHYSKTAQKNVDNLMKNYQRLVRLAGKEYEQHITASYSSEPKGSTGYPTSRIESMVVEKITAQQILQKIYVALHSISREERTYILRHYKNTTTITDIIDELNISQSTYYRKLEQARLAFAETYGNGELLECIG